ncbi:uncharacterized protein [Rutidosis leptorrhynchoides]|uniref:uncharacterized protein n=1 Tax=Rutidosis leptorrhynchoides TaxID=125765 RepID=UPI003A992C79
MKIFSLNIRGLRKDDLNKLNWFKKLCFRECPDLIALQETKSKKFPEYWIHKIWGNNDFKYSVKNSKGNSGGLLMVWDPNIFVANLVVERDSFIAIRGKWKDAGSDLIVINIYGSHSDEKKKKMWHDLNEVRFCSERKNSKFSVSRAARFNEFIKNNNLLDLPLGGRMYTRISDNGRKFSKLDRFLVSDSFIAQWPNTSALVLDKKYTDHCPILLKDVNVDFGPKPVKVFDEWLKHKDSHDIIEKAWNLNVNSSKPDCVFRDKLKNVKLELRRWFSTSQGKLNSEIEDLTKIKDNNNFELNEWNGPKLDSHSVEGLKAPFSENEVFEAIKGCGKNKAPGPDGFNFLFFSKFWDIIKVDLLHAINWFWETGIISNGCNASFITLIPKIHEPLNFSNYRPISLIGSYYKILSKLLTNRIRKIIPWLIGEEQSAFISDRYILDGVLVALETIDDLKARKQKSYIFKVDFEKAFDCLDWDFLTKILGFMGFGCKWIKWINSCLNSTSIFVLINGSPTEHFFPKRGVSQGDPLAPFLFILASEGLNYLLNVALNNKIISGVEVGHDKVVVSHLQYADDTIIFGRWNKVEVRNTLKINLSKSNVYGIGTSKNELSLLASWFGCNEGFFPFNYLGLPIGENLKLHKNWQPIFDKFKLRLSDWKAKTISFGGRLTLVKSVLSSLPLYYFSLFKAPVRVLNDLEGLRRNFFWGGSMDHKKMAWDKWCGDVIFRAAYPRLYRLESNKTATVSDRVNWADPSAFTWAWSVDPKWRAESELDCLISKLRSYVPSNKPRDFWSWKYHSSGRFSTKSLVDILVELSVANQATPTPTITNSLLPQKIGIFIWRAVRNKLPVRTELDIRGIDLHTSRCPICDDDIENLQHTLLKCKFASDVWDRIRNWWGIDNLMIDNLSDLSKATNSNFKHPDIALIWQSVIWVACYLIWKNRNNKVFNNNSTSPPKLLSDIQSKCYEWINYRGKSVSIEWLTWISNPFSAVRFSRNKEGIG